MPFAIYKPGQGYWTRTCTAVGVGMLVLAGVVWLWQQMAVLGSQYVVFIRTGSAVALVAVFSLLTFWLLNKPNIVDFMIATEAEMRKVSWPTRRELVLSTWVVICGTFLMALFLFVIDLVFVYAFQLIGVLEKGVS